MTPRSQERGSVTVFTVVMTVALLFMAGLVFDGGQILNARRVAANIAESAARAGAQELDEDAARGTGATTLDAWPLRPEQMTSCCCGS
ncbi:MAG: Tad domain-containing protein [Acidimicrobiales bacterium]